MSGALELIDLTFAYEGEPVVRGVSLAVGAGEIVCLLGPSGCGKTTCLRIAAGLERPDRGEVRIAGRTVAGPGIHVPPEKRGVGLVLQDFALFPHLTVADNVAFGIARGSRSAKRHKARELLAQMGLADYATVYPHQLSGGQQQRVAVARALAPEPAAMLMDEPFSGLDATLRGGVRESILRVLKARRVPTLIVTHDPEEALAVANRVAIMREGEIVQVGSCEEVYLNPATPFVMTFFGVPNRLQSVVTDGRVMTPFGPIPRPDLKEGTPVHIFFRGSALSPATGESGTAMRVEDARFVGPVQRVRLRPAAGGPTLVMEHARRHAVRVGEELYVKADLDEFHVFFAEQPIVEEGFVA